jgi:agmatine deiminase
MRWPAEWEPHTATWLAWPHNRETWPGRLEGATAAFVAMVGALHEREQVRLLVRDDPMEDAARRHLAAGGVDAGRIGFVRLATNDSWMRDFGPIFVERSDGPAFIDFGFDCWGGKYPASDLDDAVPGALEELLGLPRLEAGFVLEGGSIDGNGLGTILTTESCLLHPNRGAGRSREEMERRLERWLGAGNVLWLGDGIEGDDTDGHVDDIARFVDASTVVAVEEPDASDPNHGPLADNLRRLRRMRDQAGRPLAVVPLPMPPPLRAGGQRFPASYANFYLANGVALVPVFGAPSDARALSILEELLPGREVVGIDCGDLVRGLGAIHCVTQQQPA